MCSTCVFGWIKIEIGRRKQHHYQRKKHTHQTNELKKKHTKNNQIFLGHYILQEIWKKIKTVISQSFIKPKKKFFLRIFVFIKLNTEMAQYIDME